MLSTEDQHWIDSLCLPALQDHQLRLLAHALRTLQTIAARRQGAIPDSSTIQSWVLLQPQIAGDLGFTQAFVRELVSLGDLLNRLATKRSVTPLSLEPEDLLAWIEQNRSPSPNRIDTDPGCDHRHPISAPPP